MTIVSSDITMSVQMEIGVSSMGVGARSKGSLSVEAGMAVRTEATLLG